MTTTPEALGSKKSPDNFPVGTAFRKVQELYGGLRVEARPFDDMTVEKIANFEDGSWIRMAMIAGGIPNNRILLSIIDNEKGISVQCEVSSNGESSIRLSLPHKRISVGGVIVPEGYANHDMILKPEARDEEQVMSALVDWAQKSIDGGAIAEHPYQLEDVSRTDKKSPSANSPTNLI